MAELKRTLPRFIAAQIDYLIENSTLKVDNFRSGGPTTSSLPDRFTVLVPCFLEPVRWELVFSCDNPWCAPDVIFSTRDHDFRPLVSAPNSDTNSLRSILNNWNSSKADSLFRLLTALRALYLQYQWRRVMDVANCDPRLQFEVGTMKDFEGLETGLTTGLEGMPEVVFSLPLREVDLSPFLNLWPTVKRFEDIRLEARFPVNRGMKPNSSLVPKLKLHSSSVLKDVFDVQEVKLPAWADKMCLLEYVPLLQDTLNSQAREAYASIGLRKSLVEALNSQFGRPLETDTVYWKRTSFFVMSNVFAFLVHFSVPICFPKVQPKLILQSSQHFDPQGRPVSRTYGNYPWSPRWETEEMSQRICAFMTEEIPSFKQFCNETLQ